MQIFQIRLLGEDWNHSITNIDILCDNLVKDVVNNLNRMCP